MYSRASSPTAPSSVAEKNIVCRFRGRRRTIRSTCGLNPMSSMRSASSSTRIRIPPSSTRRRSRRSIRRPGVATSRCARRARLAWAERGTPPWTAATARPFGPPTASSSSLTCRASSRVGTRTSARGPSPPRSVRSTIGIAKASVLPDPVGDFARTSSPARASGRTEAWMSKGSRIERVASWSTMTCDTPSSRKDCLDKLFNSLNRVETCCPERPKEEREARLTGLRNCRPCDSR